MHLSKVEIENFRSLRHLDVNLQPGLNVIAGRNNVGKTNLFQAIRHAIGRTGARGDSLWLDRDDFYRESPSAEPATEMSVKLTFSNLSEQQRAYFFEIVNFDLSDLAKSTANITFTATWPNGKKHPSVKRTGGPESVEPPEVPAPLLESLPITFLPALRDAEAFLVPGPRSRLAQVLEDIASRDVHASQTQDEIKTMFREANVKLEGHRLVKKITGSLQSTTKGIAGSDYSPSSITAAESDFRKILRGLQVQMDAAPITSLDANGLGYNNLIYIAVVLEHLKSSGVDECPLLLLEEPEAHLHPQLTVLLADFLSTQTPGNTTPQTIVTTHSPVLAAKIPPSRMHVLFTDSRGGSARCNSVGVIGVVDEGEKKRQNKQEMQLQRIMDVTRATLYFAKGILLVEGISEALLVPVFAKRMGQDLAKLQISVIPICGVAFGTFKEVLGPEGLAIPAAIVTDGDPQITRGENWNEDQPETDGDRFKPSARTVKLKELFQNHATVQIFHSDLTLEYDLAAAGDKNAMVMTHAWADCFAGLPQTFNADLLQNAGPSLAARALCAWRGICRANNAGSKAEFAHHLAARLEETNENGTPKEDFVIPTYIKNAIGYVAEKVKSTVLPVEAPPA